MSAQSFPLPFPFPDGKAWAAIKHGDVVDMVYMDRFPSGMPFHSFRQVSRARLAKVGSVMTGEVVCRAFVARTTA